MPDLFVHKGRVSKLLEFFIQDTRQSDGSGLTGLVFNTASLNAYYYREGAASAVQITLATMTLGTWATGGFVVVDGTNQPGLYQLSIPDAALASGADSVYIFLKGAANMAVAIKEIQLTDVDLQDAVRLGLTSLPNVASGSAGALPTTGSGANQISVASGQVTAASVQGNVTGSVGSVTGNVGGSVGSVTGNVGGNVVGSVASVTAGVTVTTNSDKTGYALTGVEEAAIAAAVLAATIAELAQAQPPTTPTLAQALALLYMSFRNTRTVTATTDSITNNAGTVIAKSAISDDGTTFSRAKLVSGP